MIAATLMVLRGGSWYFIRDLPCPSLRSKYYPGNRFHDIGFRVVVARKKR